MRFLLPEVVRAHVPELVSGLAILAVFSAMALRKRRFVARAAKWPSARARIENVFVDADNDRTRSTHAVLAYGYSVDGSCYSGEIRLLAGGSSVEFLTDEMVGKEISVHYNPEHPGVSVFTRHKVRGWNVV